MDADELFDHALSSLPAAVGDLLRDGKDPRELVFASFDGASQLGMAFIATDLALEEGSDTETSRAAVQRMLAEAEADPVEALDAARRAVTHARDADALARYSAMGRN